MRVLVTGGAGFIGSHIVDAFIEEGHEVSIVDDLTTGSSRNVNRYARLFDVDITKYDALERTFEEARPEVVSHHAAQTSVSLSMADPSRDALINVVGSINVLRLSVKYGARRLIFASSSAVYSEPSYIPMDESHPTAPQSAYGMSKYTVENYMGLFSRAYGMKYKVFRYGNAYGPRQNPKGEAGVVAIFAGQMLGGAQPTIFGDGSKTRDYVYVSDIVNANLIALTERGDNETYNIASGVEVSVSQIFEEVRQAAGASGEAVHADKRPGEADRVSLDSSRARAALGWEPQVPLREGIQLTVEWHRQQLEL